MTIEQITDDFTWVMLFTATFCGPCKVLKPIIANLSEKHNLPVMSVDAETSQLARSMNITRVPTTLLYKSGEKVFEFAWAMQEEDIENLLSQEKII